MKFIIQWITKSPDNMLLPSRLRMHCLGRFVRPCLLTYSLFVGLIETNAFAESYQFFIKNIKSPEGYTVIIKAKEEILLVADESGHLKSPLDESKDTFELKLGEYPVEILFQGKVFHQKLLVTSKTEKQIFINIRKEWFEGDPASSEGTTNLALRVDESSTPTHLISGGGLYGGIDLLQRLRAYPGLVGEFPNSNSLAIRGMQPEDTLFVYDGMRIGSPMHLFGFASAMPEELIGNLQLHSGGGAFSFANVQGSVVELQSPDRGSAKPDMRLDANTIGTRFQFTTPLSEQVYLSFGLRRSYYDWYVNTFVQHDPDNFKRTYEDFELRPVTYDYNATLGWALPSGHNLYGLIMQTSDSLRLKPNLTEPESLSFESVWELQALVYKFKGDLVFNRFVAYRILKVDSFHLAAKALGWESVPQNTHDYSLGNQISLRFSELIVLNTGFHYTFQEQAFTSEDYTANFEYEDPEAPSLSPKEKLEALLERNTNLVQHNSLRRFFEGNLGAILLWGRFRSELGAVLLWNNANQQIDLNPRMTLAYHPLPNAILYVKWGRYSQLPSMWHINPKYGVPQLKNQHATHAIAGNTLSFGSTSLNMEAYHNRLRNQWLPNPTFDLAYDPSPNQNPPMLGHAQGYATGFEAFLKHKVGSNLSGHLGYTTMVSKRQRYPYVDSFDLVAEARNNGLDYMRLDSERFYDVAPNHRTHRVSLAAVLSVLKGFRLGTQVSYMTGKPHNPLVVGYKDLNGNNTMDAAEPLQPEDATPRHANSTRLPNRLLIDLQIEYHMQVFNGAEWSLYCNLWNLNALFLTSVNNIFYDESALRQAQESYQLNDALPYTEVNDLPFLPVFGMRLTF